MYGQMTAGSWIYIGTQGILQGTYETLRRRRAAATSAARWRGTLIVTAGLGGMGGAQPLAHDQRRRRALASRSTATRIERRARRPATSTSWPTTSTTRCARRRRPPAEGRALSRRRSWATPPTSCRSCCAAAWRSTSSPTRRPPTTRSTATSRRLLSSRRPTELRARDPAAYIAALARPRWPSTSRHARLQATGAPRCSTTATTCAPRRRTRGVDRRLRLPGFVPAYIRPALLRGQGAVPLGGALRRPRRHRRHRPGGARGCSPTNEHLARWLELAARAGAFQGLPARICWLGYGERAKAGLRFNELVAQRRAAARRSSSAATTSTAARSPRPTARPRRCATAPTPSPTGRS